MVAKEVKLSVFFTCLFVAAANAALYTLVVSLREYYPKVRELMLVRTPSLNFDNAVYAVWPTRLRLSEAAITGVPRVLFRRRPKPFVRRMSWRPMATGVPRVTRHLRYAVAPERVIVLN